MIKYIAIKPPIPTIKIFFIICVLFILKNIWNADDAGLSRLARIFILSFNKYIHCKFIQNLM